MAEPIEASATSAPAHHRPSALGIRATATRIGHYRWIEQRLFEMLGAWATSVPEASVALRLGVHCHLHAQHADLWLDRLPALRDVTPEQVTVASDGAVADVVAAVAASTDTVERLVGVYRVLVPHLAAAYRDHLDHTNSLTDGPTARVLTLALRDLDDEVAEGEALISGSVRTADDAQRADAHRSRLEQQLASTAGLVGDDPLAAPGFRV